MHRRLVVLALIAALVSSCNRPPNTATPQDAAPRNAGALDAATPLATLIRDRDIQPLDPTAATPLLEQAQAALLKSDPARRWSGITYHLSGGNVLPRDWLVQSPLVWGRNATTVNGTPHSAQVLKAIGELVASARQSVDITMLHPPADGGFLAALREGLRSAARANRPITVRILVGQYPPEDSDPNKLVAALADIVQGSRVSLYVAAMRSCTGGGDCNSFSWNHSKIVSVDGRAAMVGGHNMYAGDYLGDDPVFDLSMRVVGRAAADATRFTDRLWQFVCTNLGKLSTVKVASLAAGSSQPGTNCAPSLAPAPADGGGATSILAVGRMGAGIAEDFANHSDLARDLMLGAARQSIRIVQQDIAFTYGRPDALYPESTLEKLADFLAQDRGDVYIVLSNLGSVGKVGGVYSNGVSLEAVTRKIFDVTRKRSTQHEDALIEQLCRRLHVAPIRFGPDQKWPNGKTFANHAKFWMVDDRYFYIGSDNFYPVNLQEFGYIVDSRAGAADLRRDYWDKLWEWSKVAAISGSEAFECVLRHRPVRKSGQ